MTVCNMNILLLLVTSSLALPTSPEKRSIPASDPTNLIKKTIEQRSAPDSDLPVPTGKPQNKTTPSESLTEKPLDSLHRRVVDLTTDEFKIHPDPFKIPDGFFKTPEVQADFPLYKSPETHIIRVPEPYIIKVPHIIVVKEHHFINADHFGVSPDSGPFHPFGEFPSITPSFPNGENIFDISQIYPTNPIEISQGFEGFAPISGVSEIQGFPGFGDTSQGFDILKPEQISTINITGEKIDEEKESVAIESLDKLNKKSEEASKPKSNDNDDNITTTEGIKNES